MSETMTWVRVALLGLLWLAAVVLSGWLGWDLGRSSRRRK